MDSIESVSVPLNEVCTVSTGLKVIKQEKENSSIRQGKGDRVFHASNKLNRSCGHISTGLTFAAIVYLGQANGSLTAIGWQSHESRFLFQARESS